jgi:hypothetical protein
VLEGVVVYVSQMVPGLSLSCAHLDIAPKYMGYKEGLCLLYLKIDLFGSDIEAIMLLTIFDNC